MKSGGAQRQAVGMESERSFRVSRGHAAPSFSSQRQRHRGYEWQKRHGYRSECFPASCATE
eukprot:254948-Prymnesium_polylepis.1